MVKQACAAKNVWNWTTKEQKCGLRDANVKSKKRDLKRGSTLCAEEEEQEDEEKEERKKRRKAKQREAKQRNNQPTASVATTEQDEVKRDGYDFCVNRQQEWKKNTPLVRWKVL